MCIKCRRLLTRSRRPTTLMSSPAPTPISRSITGNSVWQAAPPMPPLPSAMSLSTPNQLPSPLLFSQAPLLHPPLCPPTTNQRYPPLPSALSPLPIRTHRHPPPWQLSANPPSAPPIPLAASLNRVCSLQLHVGIHRKELIMSMLFCRLFSAIC